MGKPQFQMPERVLRKSGTSREQLGHHPSALEGLTLHANVGRSRPHAGVAERMNDRAGGPRLLTKPLTGILDRAVLASAETAPYGGRQRYRSHAAEDPTVPREPIRHA